MFDEKRSGMKGMPFGLFSIVFVGAVLVWQWFFVPSDHCAPLKERLQHNGAYFLNWRAPELTLVMANKEQYRVNAESQTQACALLLDQLKANK